MTRTRKSSTVLAIVGATSIPVTIYSGADTNCISLNCDKEAGVKEMKKVRAPGVIFVGDKRVEPLGMVSILMKFHKPMEAVPVKVLVFQELVPEYLLDVHGQDQLETRFDKDQNLVWISGMLISLNCSRKKPPVNLGAVHLNDAFKEKLINFKTSERSTNYYSSDIELDLLIAKISMSIEIFQVSAQEIDVEPSLSNTNKDEI
eukprot:NODE_183_length_15731_cov_0.226778.p6 type:complete len:203 gc:universal NODE_183_length_15731_cov_0.226778:12932-12324(-)